MTNKENKGKAHYKDIGGLCQFYYIDMRLGSDKPDLTVRVG